MANLLHYMLPACLLTTSLVWAQNAVLEKNLFEQVTWVEQVVYDNGYLYAACQGAGLQIYDVSNPNSPIHIGSLNTDGETHAIQVVGTIAYLADHAKFRTIDISNPSLPVELDNIQYGAVLDVEVVGSYAYLATGWSQVKVVDVSNPANIIESSSNGSGFVRFVEVSDNILFTSGFFEDMDDRVYNIDSYSLSNPANPNYVTTHGVSDEPVALSAMDDKVFISRCHSGIDILSYDSSGWMSFLLTLDTPDCAHEVTEYSENVYAVGDYNQVRFYDFTNYPAIFNTRSYTCNYGPHHQTCFDGDRMFIALYDQGINIATITPSSVINEGMIKAGKITDVALKNNTLYAMNENRQMQIVDVSDLQNPVYQGVFSFPEFPQSIISHPTSDIVYLALENGGISVVDVSNPMSPTQIRRVTTSGSANGLYLRDDLLVSCNWNGGVQLFDVSDPSLPVSQSTWTFSRETEHAYVSGDIMAVVTKPDWGVEGGSVHIFDVSDIANPVHLSQITYEEREIGDVCIDLNQLYVAAWDMPTQIYDIQNPSSPVLIGSVAAQAIGVDMEVSQGVLFASHRENGFRFSNVSNPEAAVFLSNFRTDWSAWGFERNGSRLFVATEYYVQVLDVSTMLPANGDPAFLAVDPCEEEDSSWSLWSNGSGSVSRDSAIARMGGASVKGTTTGDIMSLTWVAPGSSALDLSAATNLRVWTRVENDYSFQINSPRVRLGNGGAYVQYSPTTNLLNSANGTWLELVIPLAGGGGWTRTEQGMSTLESVRWIEFYSDTWDYAYTWWLDGLRVDPVGCATDCNANEVADIQDLAGGFSVDANGNGLPDECECAAGTLSIVDVTLPFTGSTNTVGAPDVIGSTAGEVAYRFTLAASATISFSSCHPATDFDTDSYLFSGAGPCEGGAQLLFNSSGAACASRPGASQWTQVDLSAGTYVLLVTGAGSEEGNVTFTLQSPVSQELPVDAHTQLLLRFNNSTTGVQGETPAISSGVSYAPGRVAQGASLSSGDRLTYSRTNNITATQGTVEGWIKPEWNGNDGLSHWLLTWGTSGGILMGKDGANNWRIILNRYSSGGQPENGVSTNVAHWLANQWHHVAFTWDAAIMRVYVDGSLAAEAPVTITLPAITTSTFQIGGEGTGSSLRAVVDEFRISDVARSAQEIADSYAMGLQILSFYADPDEIALYPTWHHTPSLTALTDLGAVPVPALLAEWSSANPSVATVSAEGRITALAGGAAVVTATYQGQEAPITVTVTPPLLQPIVEALDPFLATPAADAIYEMPVVIISYLPTQDGVHLDADLAAWGNTLDDMRQQIAQKDIRVKFALEEGSKFRGYDHPDAQPSLGYRVVEKITVFEPLPLGPGGPDVFQPDYAQILTRFNAQHWVNDLGVKEIWLWGYHHGNIAPVESNMSSPTTGDISNSWRIDDLPVYDRTYVLYNYNFTRSQAEAVHDHGHQLEAILSHVNWLQDGNTNLFWRQFSGRNANDNPITGRCGNTHMPPNTINHYDYLNPATVASDIRQWQPSGGPTTQVNYHTWGDHPYSWPYGEWNFGQREETHWYIFWMQSMPGFQSAIPYNATTLTNWWAFTADWDAAIQGDLGLYGAPVPAAPQLTVQAVGADAVLQWNDVGQVNYLVYRSQTANGPFQYLGRTTGTSYVESGGLAGTQGFYRVLASYPAID